MAVPPKAAVSTEEHRKFVDEQWEKRSRCDQCLTPIDPWTWDAVKILPCLHILCNDVCAEKNKSEEDEGEGICCPKCFHIVGVTEMNECLEFGLAIHGKERRLLCTYCTDGNRAYFFCKDCDDPMCDGCNAGHLRLRRSADHVVVPITADFTFPEKSVKCEVHSEVDGVMYCKTCETALCAQCGGDQTHMKHEVLAMDVYLDGIWKNVEETTHKIKEFVPKTETIESEIKNQQTILLDYKNSEPFKRTKKNLKRIIELLVRAEIKVRGELKATQQKKYGTWDKKIHFLQAVKVKTAHFVENLGDGPKLANHDLLANRKIIQKRLENMNTDVMVCERLPIDDESEDEDCRRNMTDVQSMDTQSCNKTKSDTAKKSEEPLPCTSTSTLRAVRNQCSRLVSKYVNPTEFSEEEWELIETAQDLPDGSDDDESDSEEDEEELASKTLGPQVMNGLDSVEGMEESVVEEGVSVPTVENLELITDKKEKTTGLGLVKDCKETTNDVEDLETTKTLITMMNGGLKGNDGDSEDPIEIKNVEDSIEEMGNDSMKLNDEVNVGGVRVMEVEERSNDEDWFKVSGENGIKKTVENGGGSTVEMNGKGSELDIDFLVPSIPTKAVKIGKRISPEVTKNVDVKSLNLPKTRISELGIYNPPVKKVSRFSLAAPQSVKNARAEASSGSKRKMVDSDAEGTKEVKISKGMDSKDVTKRSERIRERKINLSAKAHVPPPQTPPPPPSKSRRANTSRRGRGPGRPAKVRDPIVPSTDIESTKPRVDVSPVPAEMESAAPTQLTSVPTQVVTTVPTQVATTVSAQVATTVPAQVSTTVSTQVSTTVPTPVATTVPTPVATTVPTPVATTVPTPVATTVPAQVGTTVPAQVSTTVPAQMTTTPPSELASTDPTEVTSGVTVKPPIEEGECSICLMTGEGDMVSCASCMKIYHQTCHLPAMTTGPTEDWNCIVCRDMGGLDKPTRGTTTFLALVKASKLEVTSPLPRKDFLLACRFLAVMLQYTRCPAMLKHVMSRNEMRGEEEYLNFDMIRMRLTLGTPTPYVNATDIIKDIETMLRQSKSFFTSKNNAYGIDTVDAIHKFFVETMNIYYPKWKQVLEPVTGIMNFEMFN